MVSGSSIHTVSKKHLVPGARQHRIVLLLRSRRRHEFFNPQPVVLLSRTWGGIP